MWRHKWGLGSKYDWINLQNKRNKSLQLFLAILPASNRKCSWQTAQQGWRTAEVLPVEFGSGGSVATSGTGLQKQMGIQAKALRQVTCIQGSTVKQRLRKKKAPKLNDRDATGWVSEPGAPGITDGVCEGNKINPLHPLKDTKWRATHGEGL